MSGRLLVAIVCSALAFESMAETPFEKAVRTGDLQGISQHASSAEYIDTPGTNDKTALMIAARAGDSALVKELLKLGSDPNANNVNGGTPIMFAAISGDPETIALLLKRKVDVNAQGSNGWSALMVAAAKGHVEACRLIIEAGANVNSEDIYLWTPLLRAAYEDRLEVIELLLAQDDVDIHHRDDHGATALHHAASIGATLIVELLLLSGANATQEDFTGRTAEVYAKESGHIEVANSLRLNSYL